VFELSKVDHFKNRLEFIRFRFKLLWHLFEIGKHNDIGLEKLTKIWQDDVG